MTDVTVASQNKPPIVILRERLETRKAELKHALVDVTPEAFIRAVITSATINPDIQACSWQSVWTACLRACRDNLLPDGVEGAIVPFKSTATWIPMYSGLLRRFRRSGQFKWITANVVREGEEFNHFIDEHGEHFYHKPGDSVEAPIVKIYALATTKDGGVFVTVMSYAEAMKIRNMSRTTREDAPWKMWESEMLRKTAIRRLSKMLPTGRDIIGDDESDDDSVPTPSVASSTVTRIASSPKEALDQFAGEVRRTDEPVEQEQGPVATEGPVLAAGPAPDSTDPKIAIAWQRGRDDRSKGVQKRALPPEFRTPDRTAEAIAWTKGWDGEGMNG